MMSNYDDKNEKAGMKIDGVGEEDTGRTYERSDSGYEKMDGASRTDRVDAPGGWQGGRLRTDPMNNAENRAERRRKREFRATMVTIVCLLVAIGAVVIAMDGYSPWRDGRVQQDVTEEGGGAIGAVPQEEAGLDVVQPMPTVDSRDNEDAGAGPDGEGATLPPGESKSPYVQPVAGPLLNDYSMDVPIYSKTLDQYVIHTGVDIEAGRDSQVKAMAEGTVTAVYEDDRLGNTVDIAHGNGLVSRYANLSKGILVEVGDVVKQGQVIAGVGDTSLFESAEPPHLHFEVLKDEQPVDPNNYIKF